MIPLHERLLALGLHGQHRPRLWGGIPEEDPVGATEAYADELHMITHPGTPTVYASTTPRHAAPDTAEIPALPAELESLGAYRESVEATP